MRFTKYTIGFIGAGIILSLAISSCSSNPTATPPSTVAKSSATTLQSASTQLDKTSYGSDEIDVNVVPHAIMMVNTDAQGAAAGQAGYKTGVRHDVIAPSTFVIKSGDKITLHAWNYDDGQHSMTLDDPTQIPGFSLVIAPGKKNADGTITPQETTITFTAPTVAKGTILDVPWYCAFPCDGPTHLGMETTGNNIRGYDGIMAGHIIVMA
ncbi:MAG: hypothetical protein HKL80_07830 [Acidimicrobiales bacterium]|nr:hypothetical protein [Acidimicrobiales bacterium]